MLHRLRDFVSRPRRSRSLRTCRRCRLWVEELEGRTLLSVFTPAGIRLAYGFDQSSLTGRGQTIAIIDAYANPTIAQDLGTFNSQFQLPQFNGGAGSPTLTVASPQGRPATDTGWAGETALDVEWAHAIAPQANILLVQAAAPTLDSLLGAVRYANQQPGVSVVSMSWGTPEFAGQTSLDHYFTAPGVTYVASSGDSGAWYGADWPAASPNVVSVGGTALSVNPDGSYAGETAWSSNAPGQPGSGGGISAYESEPAYQQGVQQTGARTTPDVAYNASPDTGYPVYDATNGGWLVAGGTSAGAPQVAGLIALADQGRAAAGQAPLTGSSQTLPALYQMAATAPATYFHDVTSGSNGYVVGPGYDLVTGLGSPQANAVVQGLVNARGTGTSLTLGTPTPTTPTAKASRTTHTVHHHDVTTPAPGTGTTPIAPVGQGTNAGQVTAGAGALASQVTLPPTVLAPVTAGSPVLAGGTRLAPVTAAPASLAAVPASSARGVVGDLLDGGGGGSSLLPADGTEPASAAPLVPDLSVPDVVPDLVPSDIRVADRPGALPAGPAARDVYFMEETVPAAIGEAEPLVVQSAGAVKPLAASGLALLLGGLWSGEARSDAERKGRW